MWKPQKNSQKHLCCILFLIILEASRLLLYLKELLIWNTYLLEYLQITASLQRASYFTINRFFIKLVRITFMYQRVPVLILQWKWGIFRGSVSVRGKNHTHVKKMGQTSEFPLGIYWWTLKNPQNQNFEKMKKIDGHIIILHMCTKNHNHMRYRVRQNFFCHFGPSFALLLPTSPL